MWLRERGGYSVAFTGNKQQQQQQRCGKLAEIVVIRKGGNFVSKEQGILLAKSRDLLLRMMIVIPATMSKVREE